MGGLHFANSAISISWQIHSVCTPARSVELICRGSQGCVRMCSRKGHLQFFMKEYDKAAATYEAGLKHDPENAELLEGCARCQEAINKVLRLMPLARPGPGSCAVRLQSPVVAAVCAAMPFASSGAACSITDVLRVLSASEV